jgi:hypothetical protein
VDAARQQLIDWVFPNLAQNCSNPGWIAERAILTPRNSHVVELNFAITNRFPGEPCLLCSADETVHEDQATTYSVDHLNTLNPSC